MFTVFHLSAKINNKLSHSSIKPESKHQHHRDLLLHHLRDSTPPGVVEVVGIGGGDPGSSPIQRTNCANDSMFLDKQSIHHQRTISVSLITWLHTFGLWELTGAPESSPPLETPSWFQSSVQQKSGTEILLYFFTVLSFFFFSDVLQ